MQAQQQTLLPEKVAEVKLTYKTKQSISTLPKIENSRDIRDVLSRMWSEDMDFVESFNLLLLNRGLRVLGFFHLSKGGTASTIVDVRLVFSAAILANATSIVLAHNHPSGNVFPSKPDIDLTKKIVEGSKLLDIQVLDHIIMSSEDYYSFADEGML